MPALTINGKKLDVPPGTALIQACEAAGVEIPRFCYHERLSVAGNCRMCLVEVEKQPKLTASCAVPALDGMIVRTDSEKVRRARQGVMEFLLANHPLDCPICDQGGECDLQDQAMAYGLDRSRFSENKRAVQDKDMGPLVKTIMTRCIHCTRCVRFASEVAGAAEIGALGRGEDMEIMPYLEQTITSELSGNIIDLCPVGALTSKPYAFTARSWEMRSVETVDVMDAVGSNIRADARGREVMRVLPRLNEEINEEWISDKTRFAYDALKNQRLDRPYARDDQNRLRPVSWDEALRIAADRVKKSDPKKIAALAGDLACAESVKALKDLMTALASPHLDCRLEEAAGGAAGAALPPDDLKNARWTYLFNTTIAGIDEADALLLIGSHPRLEAPIINARIRRRWLKGGFPIGVVGQKTDLTYDAAWLGEKPAALADLVNGKSPFAQQLKAAKRPMLILGIGALARPDGAAIFAAARDLAKKTGMFGKDWNGFNVLHIGAGKVGALDLGFLPEDGGLDASGILAASKNGAMDLVYLLHADALDMDALAESFVIYQGSHGDRGARHADLILPGAAWSEKNALWVNTEGRAQEGRLVVFPPGEAREDWRVIHALAERLDMPLSYDDPVQLRRAMRKDAPCLAKIDETPAPAAPVLPAKKKIAKEKNPKNPPRFTDAPFLYAVQDFYLTNAVARASRTMAACSRMRQEERRAAAE